ncbi:hypothetical protein [Streptomyces sp. YGL11-2]|uniref:hypothetical protein n=1 Tax=Streptomyces sp. YGL11-2 TaxID=3414028 RepID=UPI003CED8249
MQPGVVPAGLRVAVAGPQSAAAVAPVLVVLVDVGQAAPVTGVPRVIDAHLAVQGGMLLRRPAGTVVRKRH